jgi:hypothetical protein
MRFIAPVTLASMTQQTLKNTKMKKICLLIRRSGTFRVKCCLVCESKTL